MIRATKWTLPCTLPRNTEIYSHSVEDQSIVSNFSSHAPEPGGRPIPFPKRSTNYSRLPNDRFSHTCHDFCCTGGAEARRCISPFHLHMRLCMVVFPASHLVLESANCQPPLKRVRRPAVQGARGMFNPPPPNRRRNPNKSADRFFGKTGSQCPGSQSQTPNTPSLWLLNSCIHVET